MTFKKTTRAGLLALALGVLFALFLSMSAIDRTYAEEAAAPAAAADAAPPACAGNATLQPARSGATSVALKPAL